jgi:hypothetical protein
MLRMPARTPAGDSCRHAAGSNLIEQGISVQTAADGYFFTGK